MSKKRSYLYSGTKGHIIAVAETLPLTGDGLLARGWEDVSHPKEAERKSYVYREPNTGLKIRYDTPTPGAPGFRGKHHFHILNPKAHNDQDRYLDKNGVPCPNNSNRSHILPTGDRNQ